jgi:hypothetical protein
MQWFVRLLLSSIYKKDEHLIVLTREFANAPQKAKLGKQFAIVPAGIDGTKFSPQLKIDGKMTDSLKKMLDIDSEVCEILLFASVWAKKKTSTFC